MVKSTLLIKKMLISLCRELVEKKSLSHNQVFNCDEMGLNYRLLPESTLASSFEKSADGRKKSKDRVTLNVCSNISGNVKLPIHLIGTRLKDKGASKALGWNCSL